ncbi:MAG: polysaccharide deacetylase family protein [Saprospirales bacterium]|nr:polysaccharide deacetylase family protein [Saprospirales bacterium]
MKIKAGIGILSYNRPGSLSACLDSLFSNLPAPATVAVSFDQWNAAFQAIAAKYPIWALVGDTPGIPHANNRLLAFFADYDAIFLVQDDMRFLRPEWLERYLRALQAVHYLAFFDPYYPQSLDKPRHFKVNFFNRRTLELRNGEQLWRCHKSPQGAMQAFSRKCIQTVGFFDEKFGQYGMEHHDYWLRTCNAGFAPSDHFYDLVNSAELLKIDWGQPPSFTPEEKQVIYAQSAPWRKELYEESSAGLQRVKVEQGNIFWEIKKRGPRQKRNIALPARDLTAEKQWIFRSRLPVLAYHAIDESPGDRYAISPRMFEAHIEGLLSEKFRFITASGALEIWRKEGAFSGKELVLTFDDGYSDFMDIEPFLSSLGIRATIFLPVNWVGRNNDWDRGAFRARRHLCWEEVAHLSSMGHEFGSHGLEHFGLTRLTLEAVKSELEESQRKLNQALALPVRSVAYPFGRCNPAIEQIAGGYFDLGFVSGSGGKTDWDHAPFAIRRIPVFAGDSIDHLRLKMADYMTLAPEKEPVWFDHNRR